VVEIPIRRSRRSSVRGAHEEVAMSAEETRATLQQYVEALIARGDYGRFFDDEIEFVMMGTDQQARGAKAAEQAIRFIHETAFDAEPEFIKLVVDERSAAAEAVFVGTHTGEFAGVSPTGNSVRVPYSVFYDVEADKITSLRVYMPLDLLVAQISGATEPEVARSSG
jgi:predicted ester cyclase